MSINKIMSQGKASLAASQIGLSTVSHNISNVNTEGYSRQRVDFQTAEPTNFGNLRLGGGVKVGNVTRSSSEFVNRRFEEETSKLGQYEGMGDILNQLQTVLADNGDKGISKAVSRFFNDVRTLSTQPESQPLRAAVRESGAAVSSRFQSVISGIDQVRSDVDRRIEGSVTDLNMLTGRISELNRRIMEVEVSGVVANDERDSRDLALQKLSHIVDVQVTPIENGGINVSAGRLGVLVNGVEPTELRTARSSGTGDAAPSAHIYQLAHDGSLGKDVTEFIEGGSLGGYISVRDRTMPEVVNNVNSAALNLVKSVNSVHQQAYGPKGETGKSFFADITDPASAASLIKVSKDVESDLNNIAAAYKPMASGDNRALLDIADIQDHKVFGGGTATFTDHIASTVGQVGIELKGVNDNMETQSGLIEQLDTVRQKLSGVSLDEEAINLVQFQRAFDASAKMIQVADSLMETVMNLKRF
ncbi:MAG: flagellar hook-associated protein FlgK [Bdellovibrionales bacterium]|nr:flagellar hook-associated protein FlgK [Bdellovibrionales bacterium]